MFTRWFGLLATLALLASVVGHLLSALGAGGFVDPLRWAATGASAAAGVLVGLGLLYQRARAAHLRREPGSVGRALGAADGASSVLDPQLAPLVASGRVRAAAVAVVGGGDSTELRAYADPQAALQPDARSIFEIGSLSKTFTALLLAQMTVAGEVRLEDEVARHLPGIGLSRDGVEATLLDLATHRAGLPRVPTGMAWSVLSRAPDPYARWDEERLERAARRTRLRAAPGARFAYSNLGFALLGLALSRAAGRRYPELLHERVLAPLGMRATQVAPAAREQERLMPGHDYFGARASNWAMAAFSPAGGIRSSAAEMAGYLRAQLQPDETPLAEAIRLAQEPRRDVTLGGVARLARRGHATRMRIGLAWITAPQPDGGAIVWHNGGTGGYGSYLGFRPSTGRGVVALTNSVHSHRLDTACAAALRQLAPAAGA